MLEIYHKLINRDEIICSKMYSDVEGESIVKIEICDDYNSK